ncbi:hypothetical protein BESB_029820 [Besnoitia besnoiti]|uniref:Uncharacterized protein n=1 Tax=Besnoitia besnoiti TaxID=94643 RepID=A0A2A9LX95_BESBE|nr:hypothetical protein BESB_029820 [Besnoitia besnoiti]PFH31108.1 hypothetical protein BESB_029820 [Besnoitia besnoiti]
MYVLCNGAVDSVIRAPGSCGQNDPAAGILAEPRSRQQAEAADLGCATAASVVSHVFCDRGPVDSQTGSIPQQAFRLGKRGAGGYRVGCVGLRRRRPALDYTVTRVYLWRMGSPVADEAAPSTTFDVVAHEVKLLEQQSGRSLGGHGQRLLRCQEKAHPAPVHLHCSRKDALEPSPALIVLIDLLLDGRHWMTFACAGTLIVGCALRIVRAYLQEHGAAAATSSVSAAAHAPSSSGSATPGSNPKTGSPADQLPKPAPAEEGDKQTSSVKDSTPPSSNTVDTLKASGKDQDEAAAGAGDSETEFSSLTSTAGACESCLRTITIVQIAGTFSPPGRPPGKFATGGLQRASTNGLSGAFEGPSGSCVPVAGLPLCPQQERLLTLRPDAHSREATSAVPSDFPAGALPADQLPFIPLTPLERAQLALRLGEQIKASPMTRGEAIFAVRRVCGCSGSLTFLGTENAHSKIRSKVAQHMMDNFDKYSWLIEAEDATRNLKQLSSKDSVLGVTVPYRTSPNHPVLTDDESKVNWLVRLYYEGYAIWANESVIVAAADLFGIRLVIENQNKSGRRRREMGEHAIQVFAPSDTPSSTHLPTIFLGVLMNKHFVFIQKVDERGG